MGLDLWAEVGQSGYPELRGSNQPATGPEIAATKGVFRIRTQLQ